MQTAEGFGLNNHNSSFGDTFNLGHANAGDTLTFILNNLSLGALAYSNPALNVAYDDPGSPIHNHVYSTSFTANGGVPAGTYIGFEDIRFPGADFNYSDEAFVFSK